MITLATDIDEIKRKKERAHLDAWNNLPHFDQSWDVPNIPIVEKELYETFYIPKLIGAGAISKKDLIDGQVYIGAHRRCKIARWNENINKFEYIRHKFNYTYIDTCNHFENDNGFALFVPINIGKQEDFEIL